MKISKFPCNPTPCVTFQKMLYFPYILDKDSLLFLKVSNFGAVSPKVLKR